MAVNFIFLDPPTLSTTPIIFINDGNAGFLVSIECIVDAYPIPELTWQKENDDSNIGSLETNNNILLLKFNEISRAINGTYICSLKKNTTVYSKTEIIYQCILYCNLFYI